MLIFANMGQQKKKIILSVSNDLSSDQRVHKVCQSLIEADYEVELLGRFLADRSLPLERNYHCRRFKLWFNQGPLFYVTLNLRIFFYLLFRRFDIVIANDLDTLPANYAVKLLRNKSLLYDSHEYFTEVPELIHRPFTQSFWKGIEKLILPKLKYVYTVSPSIAEVYSKKYGIEVRLIRNFPLLKEEGLVHKNPTDGQRSIVIYQGALNVGRGLEELITAFSHEILSDMELWIFGEGDIEAQLKALSRRLNLESSVTFYGRLPLEELSVYSRKAHLGVSLEKPEGLSYQYALPNKVFDYIHAGLPVLYAPLKDLKKLLSVYRPGQILRSYEPAEMANQIAEMLASEDYENWVKNCSIAARELCWQKEEKKLLELAQNAH